MQRMSITAFKRKMERNLQYYEGLNLRVDISASLFFVYLFLYRKYVNVYIHAHITHAHKIICNYI